MTPKDNKELTVTQKFNQAWNPHYNFENPANVKEIQVVEGYDISNDSADYTTGQLVDSPWGSNRVREARTENGVDVCIKEITVKPGFMLSLQRHRGREELWEVTDGVLTVIMDGKRLDIPAGESVTLPKGSVHCMINSSDKPVTVVETQSGICREKDNIRLVDFNNRATYPLTTEVEFESAKLYARIQLEHTRRYGFVDNVPHMALVA